MGKGIAVSGALSLARSEGHAKSLFPHASLNDFTGLAPCKACGRSKSVQGKGIAICTTDRPPHKAEAPLRAKESPPAAPGAGLCRSASQPSAATRTDRQARLVFEDGRGVPVTRAQIQPSFWIPLKRHAGSKLISPEANAARQTAIAQIARLNGLLFLRTMPV